MKYYLHARPGGLKECARLHVGPSIRNLMGHLSGDYHSSGRKDIRFSVKTLTEVA